MPDRDILWVAATEAELVGLAPGARSVATGVGPAAAAAGLAMELARGSDCRVVGIGIAGAFRDRGVDLLQVVRVDSERFLDLGTETESGFRALWDLEIPGVRVLERYRMDPWSRLDFLSGVDGGTCSTCTGTLDTALVRARTGVDLESMEGAAWALVSSRFGVPFHQVRAISNWVGPREKSGWRIAEALGSLEASVQQIWSNK